VQLLADSGLIRSPIGTWPLSWPDIARDIAAADGAAIPAKSVREAHARRRSALRRAAAPRFGPVGVSVALAEKPARFRTFDDVPRADGELGFDAAWMGDRLTARVAVAVAAQAEDERKIRLDASYVGGVLGNFTIAAGAVDRWWGPGWEGSLILSTNARPIPGIMVERNYSDPSRLPLLRWLGPWRAHVSMGRMEGSGVAVPDAHFFAARVNIRPARWLEIGLSRTAQWCGAGRPCDFSTFGDLLVGRDNRGDDAAVEQEPGNQMAGYDARLASPWPSLPIALYAQMIGEDEAGGLPSKFLGLAGVELWGDTPLGSYRLHAEYADTACNFSHSEPAFDCAYRNALYPDGYAFRGRAAGHALDADGRMYSAAAQLVRPAGGSWRLLLRRIELNRAGSVPDTAHTTSPASDELENAELQYNHAFTRGELRLGVGYDQRVAQRRSAASGFIEWRQEF
jgi:hypothetical protein